MAVTDISKLVRFDFETTNHNEIINIPKPNNEATIGVIDTLFDDRVYFSEWVEYHDLVKNLKIMNMVLL